tara:strand:+ start:310 stop:489 length:180 start_codon:yes stop_codon:yes gene_type:complete
MEELLYSGRDRDIYEKGFKDGKNFSLKAIINSLKAKDINYHKELNVYLDKEEKANDKIK